MILWPLGSFLRPLLLPGPSEFGAAEAWSWTAAQYWVWVLQCMDAEGVICRRLRLFFASAGGENCGGAYAPKRGRAGELYCLVKESPYHRYWEGTRLPQGYEETLGNPNSASQRFVSREKIDGETKRRNGNPKGIRTPVAGMKTRCPRPLDDGVAFRPCK